LEADHETLAKAIDARDLELSLHIHADPFLPRRTSGRCGCASWSDARRRRLLIDIAVSSGDEPPAENESPAPAAAASSGSSTNEGDVDLQARPISVGRLRPLSPALRRTVVVLIDDVRIPESRSWAAENAEAASTAGAITERMTFAQLAAEFGVTPPTIRSGPFGAISKPSDETDIRLSRGNASRNGSTWHRSRRGASGCGAGDRRRS